MHAVITDSSMLLTHQANHYATTSPTRETANRRRNMIWRKRCVDLVKVYNCNQYKTKRKHHVQHYINVHTLNTTKSNTFRFIQSKNCTSTLIK